MTSDVYVVRHESSVSVFLARVFCIHRTLPHQSKDMFNRVQAESYLPRGMPSALSWRALPRSLPLLLAVVAAASSDGGGRRRDGDAQQRNYTFLGECACATCAEARCDIVEGEQHDLMSAYECRSRCDNLGSICVAYQTHTTGVNEFEGYCAIFRNDQGNPTPTHVWGAGGTRYCTGW